MTIETLKSSNQGNRNSISVIKSKFLAHSSINTLLAMKVTDARRDVILAGGLYHRFPWRHLTQPPPASPEQNVCNALLSNSVLEIFSTISATVHYKWRFLACMKFWVVIVGVENLS